MKVHKIERFRYKYYCLRLNWKISIKNKIDFISKTKYYSKKVIYATYVLDFYMRITLFTVTVASGERFSSKL